MFRNYLWMTRKRGGTKSYRTEKTRKNVTPKDEFWLKRVTNLCICNIFGTTSYRYLSSNFLLLQTLVLISRYYICTCYHFIELVVSRWPLAKPLPGANRLIMHLYKHQLPFALASNSLSGNIEEKISHRGPFLFLIFCFFSITRPL